MSSFYNEYNNDNDLDEQAKLLKDQADEQTRQFYEKHPKARAGLNKIMWIVFGIICLIILSFVLLLG